MLESEKEMVKEYTDAGCKRKSIKKNMKNRDPGCTTTMHQIYSYRHQLKVEAMEGRTVLQQLLLQLRENDYFERHRREAGGDVLRDILFSHPMSRRLARMFPYVLIMDTTYKTNKYGIISVL